MFFNGYQKNTENCLEMSLIYIGIYFYCILFGFSAKSYFVVHLEYFLKEFCLLFLRTGNIQESFGNSMCKKIAP